MPNPAIPAAGGAMPAPAPSLLNIAGSLDQARYLIIAASNLCAGENSFSEGLHAVILAAEDKLDAARAMLADLRGQETEAAHV